MKKRFQTRFLQRCMATSSFFIVHKAARLITGPFVFYGLEVKRHLVRGSAAKTSVNNVVPTGAGWGILPRSFSIEKGINICSGQASIKTGLTVVITPPIT